MYPRASLMALIVASVPELVILTISTEGNGLAHRLGELDLELRRGAEGGALPGGRLYGLDNLRVRVPED